MVQREKFTKEEFWSELDELGEDEVRVRLYVQKRYGDASDKRALAEEWLRRKAAATHDAIEQEQLQIARDAARQARLANKIAAAAFIVSVIAVLIAVFHS